jgi:HPt (histidine-containing phosphotransfer) domain-containing protein
MQPVQIRADLIEIRIVITDNADRSNTPRMIEDHMFDNMADATSPVRNEGAGARLFDADAALTRLDGDEELLVMLVGVFQQDSADLYRQLLNGVDRGDLRVIERAAHSLKGLASNFDAHEAAQAALDVERLARTGQAASLAIPVRVLGERLNTLRGALTEWEAAK